MISEYDWYSSLKIKFTFEWLGVGENLLADYARDFSPAVFQRCATPVDKSRTATRGNIDVYDVVRWYN